VKQLIGFFGAMLIAFMLLAQGTSAAEPRADLSHTGRVVISTEGDVTIPAGEHADVVIVVNGTATILGEANTVVAIDGTIALSGALVETVIAVRSPVEVGAGAVVLGDVLTLDSLVHQTGDAEVGGQVRDLASVLIGVGAVLAPALVLIWLGFGLAVVAAGLLLAGLASRQVRSAETLISRQPVLTFVVGLCALVVVPMVAFALMATIVGAPLGVGILIQLLPLVAFIGYLVAGIWVGDRLLGRDSVSDPRRPYGPAVLGLLVLQLVGLVPVLGIVTAIASLLGFGAVVRLAWSTLRSRVTPVATAATREPLPVGA
jgi:hypothetical protein